jgi:hypothetical protein
MIAAANDVGPAFIPFAYRAAELTVLCRGTIAGRVAHFSCWLSVTMTSPTAQRVSCQTYVTRFGPWPLVNHCGSTTHQPDQAAVSARGDCFARVAIFFAAFFCRRGKRLLFLFTSLTAFGFLGCGDTHCRRDRASGCPNAIGCCEQNAFGWRLCFFFLRHVMTILIRISKAGTLSGIDNRLAPHYARRRMSKLRSQIGSATAEMTTRRVARSNSQSIPCCLCGFAR